MSELTTSGLDLAKNVFPVHGIDAEGKIIARILIVALQRTAFEPHCAFEARKSAALRLPSRRTTLAAP
jgi:hypothetical protein